MNKFNEWVSMWYRIGRHHMQDCNGGIVHPGTRLFKKVLTHEFARWCLGWVSREWPWASLTNRLVLAVPSDIRDIVQFVGNKYTIVELEVLEGGFEAVERDHLGRFLPSKGAGKCRVMKARVISGCGVSNHDLTFVYNEGNVVTPDNFDYDNNVVCGGGIHGFRTYKLAEAYTL